MAKVASFTETIMEKTNQDRENHDYLQTAERTQKQVKDPLQSPPGDALRTTSSFMNENPWDRPRTGTKISFIDENGSDTPLYEITYSKKTHYSRATQQEEAPAPTGGCCSLQ